MKTLFRPIIGALLAFQAKRFLRQSGAQVVAITGSVGKTSTKEAIYAVLKPHFKVCRSQKSFNTPIGLSLAVLQETGSGFSSPLKWMEILWRAFFGKKEACQILVLEMGADSPGDIPKLMKIAPPQISVVTHVQPVHLAPGQFADLESIAREKGSLARGVGKDGTAILNADDPRVAAMPSPGTRFTFGQSPDATLRASDVKATWQGIEFRVHYEGKEALFAVPILGSFQVYVCLPAIAVGLRMGLSLEQCAAALAEFRLPPGRMNPIDGLHGSTIVDGSYNASPASTKRALELLASLEGKRKIAALGTMNELGELSTQEHLQLGSAAAQAADLLVFVGKEAATLKQGALEAGFPPEKVFTFFDSREAGAFLEDRLEPKDVVLVKGSQNQVRMEKLVKAIMKQPEKARHLLCRQGEAWESI